MTQVDGSGMADGIAPGLNRSASEFAPPDAPRSPPAPPPGDPEDVLQRDQIGRVREQSVVRKGIALGEGRDDDLSAVEAGGRSDVLVALGLVVPDDDFAVALERLRRFDFRHQHRQEIVAQRHCLLVGAGGKGLPVVGKVSVQRRMPVRCMWQSLRSASGSQDWKSMTAPQCAEQYGQPGTRGWPQKRWRPSSALSTGQRSPAAQIY
jgi:hypothetical protein